MCCLPIIGYFRELFTGSEAPCHTVHAVQPDTFEARVALPGTRQVLGGEAVAARELALAGGDEVFVRGDAVAGEGGENEERLKYHNVRILGQAGMRAAALK